MISTRFNPIAKTFLDRLPAYMEAADVPGISVALVEDGEITWTDAFGVKELGKPDLVTNETLFQAGSLSKPLFAYAILQLVEAGKIDLDNPLSGYMDEDYIPGEVWAASITPRRILSHTSGLPNWRIDSGEKLQVAFRPGEKFSYSGEGFFYLQRVVEIVTGQPFEAYMQERVLRPLGMTGSSYLWRAEFMERLASGHVDHGQAVQPWPARMGPQMLAVAARRNLPLDQWRYEDVIAALPEMEPVLDLLPSNKLPNAAASLLTTAAEFANYLRHYLKRAQKEDDRIQEFLQPQIALNRFLSWGLGWALETDGGSHCVWHSGDTGIFQCFAMGSIETQSGLVVMTNSDRGFKICQILVRESAGREGYPFLWM